MASAFEIEARDAGTAARTGVLHTRHGDVETPAFLPVATQATVKALSPRDLEEIGFGAIIANAYHLSLRPGEELIEAQGGLHRFMQWERPIFTDSGGFQIFSLGTLQRVTDEAATFRSPIDGQRLVLTPQKSIEIQQRLGSDVMVPLDHPVAYPCEREVARVAMERSLLWARQTRRKLGDEGGLLFGIAQGAVFEDLRRECAERLAELGFDGYAVGGLCLGESKELLWDTVGASAEALPSDAARHLMGVGLPEDLLDGAARGVDFFDCVVPTRNGRNGVAYTSLGVRKLRNATYKRDDAPVDPNCICYACRKFSRAYLHHLVQTEELLGLQLISFHNLFFYQTLMVGIRESIRQGVFESFRQKLLEGMRG